MPFLYDSGTEDFRYVTRLFMEMSVMKCALDIYFFIRVTEVHLNWILPFLYTIKILMGSELLGLKF